MGRAESDKSGHHWTGWLPLKRHDPPKDSGWYLATVDLGTGEKYVEILFYDKDQDLWTRDKANHNVVAWSTIPPTWKEL